MRIWKRNAIVSGIIIGSFWLFFNLVNNLANPSEQLNGSLSLLYLTTFVFLTFYSGFQSVHGTKNMKVGLEAGLITTVVSVVLGIGSMLLITFFFIDLIRENQLMIMAFEKSGFSDIRQFIISDALSGALFSVLFAVAAGAFCGSAGGYLAHLNNKRK